MEYCANSNTIAGIAVVAMVSLLFRRWRLFRRFAVRTMWLPLPAYLLKVCNTGVLCWEYLEYLNNIHDSTVRLTTCNCANHHNYSMAADIDKNKIGKM